MRPSVLVASSVLIAACYVGPAASRGDVDEPPENPGGTSGGETTGDEEPPPEGLCGTPAPGPAPLRRLTRAEYNNVVRDLLGDTSRPADDFSGAAIVEGFDNNAHSAITTRLVVEQFETAATALAETAVEDLPGLLGCDPVGDGERVCVTDFIEDFGARAYRRPLQEEELASLLGLYDALRKEDDAATSVASLLTAILQSPHFLYRVERGTGQPQEGAVALGPYEVAARLSLLLWNSIPDAELNNAAAASALETPEEVAGQAERMLADPRAEDVLADFHEQWLGVGADLHSGALDVADLLRQELRTFVVETIQRDDAKLSTLLGASHTYANAALAEYYGLDTTGMSDDFERIDWPPEQRAGVLTQGLFLARFAEPVGSSPVARGVMVRERILCMELPPPPPDAMVDPPAVDPDKTTRERYAEHRENPACAICHNLIDPVGFLFEHYDQYGQWRDDENGLPIDATGDIVGAQDPALEGVFDGAVEFSRALTQSVDARECVATQWFRYAYGRLEGADGDACTLAALAGALEDDGGDLRSLLVTLTQTDAFRFRPEIELDG